MWVEIRHPVHPSQNIPEIGETDRTKVESLNLREMSRDEVATIWFALAEYKNNIETTLGVIDYNSYEDEAFLHDALSKIARIMFTIRDDHDPQNAEMVRKWLDV